MNKNKMEFKKQKKKNCKKQIFLLTFMYTDKPKLTEDTRAHYIVRMYLRVWDVQS